MSDDSIFREIDEELRSERMKSLWRRFGPYVIGAAVAVVILVAANEGWQWWSNSKSASSSDQLYSALELADDGDIVAAQDALNTSIAEGSGEYPLLARMKQASLLVADGKIEEGVTAYDAIAATASETRIRELALVMAAFALVDQGDVAGIESRVGSMIGSGNPFASVALEALGLAQYNSGDLDAARTSFESAAADPNAPSDQAGRLNVYLAQLDAEGASGDEAGTAEESASN